jgi:hypothetical protein
VKVLLVTSHRINDSRWQARKGTLINIRLLVTAWPWRSFGPFLSPACQPLVAAAFLDQVTLRQPLAKSLAAPQLLHFNGDPLDVDLAFGRRRAQ